MKINLFPFDVKQTTAGGLYCQIHQDAKRLTPTPTSIL